MSLSSNSPRRGRTPLRTISASLVALVALWPAVTDGLSAQNTIRRPSSDLQLVLDVAVPRYGDAEGTDALETGAAILLPVNERVTVVSGVSLVSAWRSGLSSVVISNVYGSVQLGTTDGTFASVTLTLPTTGRLTNQAFAADAGLELDLERPERYTLKSLGVEASLTPRFQVAERYLVGGRVGVAAVGSAGVRREFYGRYGVFGETETGLFRLGVDLTGAIFFESRAEDIGGKTIHHGTVSASIPGIVARPRLYVQLPIDDGARAATDFVVGLRVAF